MSEGAKASRFYYSFASGDLVKRAYAVSAALDLINTQLEAQPGILVLTALQDLDQAADLIQAALWPPATK